MSPVRSRTSFRFEKRFLGELVSKIEHVVYCDLSRRQKQLYHAIQQNLNLTDLFDSDEKKVVNLMNLVVQLRKVTEPILQRNQCFLTGL